ncbi:MAG TPA: Nramp family divalent metal transporter [Chloroflexota bacterium]|nr:Nramp family divalent metal transporter [Chloroflexota bacterium]
MSRSLRTPFASVAAPSLPSATARAAADILAGRSRRRGVARLLPFLGPAFVASVAYMDPGNFATNIQGGAQFGYTLLWVIVASNLMAMLIQSLSAKLGIATGRNLPEMIREHCPRPLTYLLWVLAEGVAMATDLAEFLGAALGFHLLFGIPLLWAGLLTGVITFAILGLQHLGFRPLEAVIGAFVGVIGVCYLIELALARPSLGQIAYAAVVPQLTSDSILVAVGILGATVMPHVIYLHSALVQDRVVPRSAAEARRLHRFETTDVVIAMGTAGLINGAMLIMAAATFFGHGRTDVGSLEEAYQTLTPLLGGAASTVFAISLLASGLASSAVGTMAGQVIMQGFIHRQIPVWVRRFITMLPALVVIALGWDPTEVLVISQVTLSFGIPFALVPLLVFTWRRDIMGDLANHRLTNGLALLVTALIIALNALLLYRTFGGEFASPF